LLDLIRAVRLISQFSMKAPIPDISQVLFDLTEYCSIVTGASLGIGLKIAEALAYNGNDETWDEIFKVNVRAPMRITRAVLPEMVKGCRGSIINIGSSWSTRASVFNQDGGGVDYCSSKAALHALTRATAQYVAPKNIRVNTIAPGAVDTPMQADHRALLFEFEKYIPLGRIQVAEDLAGTVIFLASNASAYITGQTFHVNGGLLMVD
jgi:3-oxoacyl-[acyl-carrier protein] reductase